MNEPQVQLLLGFRRGSFEYVVTASVSFSSKRHVIDGVVDGVEYCRCGKKVSSVYGAATHDVPWTPFLERKVSHLPR